MTRNMSVLLVEFRKELAMKRQIGKPARMANKKTYKDRLIDDILNFHARFRFDFTWEFLDSLSVERLEHILDAAAIVKQ